MATFPLTFPIIFSTSVGWVITANPHTGVVRFTITGPAPVDLSQVQIGDYANIFGLEFALFNRGSFTITNVQVSFPGGLLTQFFEVFNPLGVSQIAEQASSEDIIFFRPTKFSIQQQVGRTVIVSQNRGDPIDIILPATSDIVTRTAKTGAYLRPVIQIVATNLVRNAAGVTTVDMATPNSLMVGDQVYIDNFIPAQNQPYRDLGAIGVSGSPGTTDADLASIWSLLRATDITAQFSHSLTLLANGNALIAGGAGTFAGVYNGESSLC